MNAKRILLGGAMALLLAAANNAQAQTVAFAGIGSSALTVALGQAAASNATIGASCVWSYGSNAVKAVDPTTTRTESGNVWIAWTPDAIDQTCTTISSDTTIYAFLQTDSVVGNRCLFNGCTIAAGSAGSPTALTNTQAITVSGSSITQVTNVPSGVWSKLSGVAFNAAGTDIRPEDAKFAINRALTSCGTAVSSSNYRGLGYTAGNAITSYYTSSDFGAINFTLPSSFSVTTVGAVPVVVSTVGSAFPTNLTTAQLASVLDGSSSYNADVLIREPLSGTYNTVEYNVPNTSSSLGNYTSQDVGKNQNSSYQNCNGTAPKTATNIPGTSGYVLNIPNANGGHRNRAIGTGEELKELFLYNTSASPSTTTSALGYAFWSTANFAGAATATSSPKYITVDSIDPLFSSSHTFTGTIPTSTSDLANVTLANVANGTYPIWSQIRLVNTGSTALSAVTALATAAQSFPSAAHPDFVKSANLTVVRSHFTPPGVTTTPNNGGSCGTEAGGDVGGVVYTSGTCTTESRK